MNRRHVYMLIALTATIAATWWAANADDENADSGVAQAENGLEAGRTETPAKAAPTKTITAGTTKRGSSASADNQTALLAQLAVADKSRREPPKLSRDLFAIMSFQPPPPPPPTPPKPTAPPLRFQYQGLLRDDDKLAVFLADGSQLLIAREGETLAGQYRVVKVTENEMILEYMPLHERQTLNFGRL